MVTGTDSAVVATAIRRVVSEERNTRPALFANSKIEVYDKTSSLPAEQRAIATVSVGAPPPKAASETPSHLNIFVPNIYKDKDPGYVKNVKLDNAGIHLALRSLLFFSGEAQSTNDTMGGDHFSELPDEFEEVVQDDSHKH
ncbi:hypothetical protein [Bradyrhizobium brasilense]|uniref:hypothetical protein n=1 Tax=Bradyrhizobium brasilense TaxID=1419277 RepID=UPI00115FDAFB|nr:hypothetical protein [Bradyrhizobium brasilense]